MPYDELPYEQLIDGLPDLRLGLHLQLVVLTPGRLRYPQLQLRLVSKTWATESVPIIHERTDGFNNNDNNMYCNMYVFYIAL